MGLGGGLCCRILARESEVLCLSRGRGILHYGYGRSPVRLRLGHFYQGHGHSPCTTVSTGPGCGKIGPLAIPGEHRPPPGPFLLVFHTKGIQSLVAPTIGSNQAATPGESLIITYLIITIQLCAPGVSNWLLILCVREWTRQCWYIRETAEELLPS